MGLKVCPSCGEEDYDEFCSKCGTKMIKALICNWCGEELWKRMVFCPGCGRSIKDATTTEPPEPSLWEVFKMFFRGPS